MLDPCRASISRSPLLPWDGPVLDSRRPLANGDGPKDGAAGFRGRAEVGRRFALERLLGLDKQRLVEGFVRHLKGGLGGEGVPQTAGTLLRGPARFKLLRHRPAQAGLLAPVCRALGARRAAKRPARCGPLDTP
jgi:hypothetical protein